MNISDRSWIFLLVVILGVAATLRIWTIGYKAPWVDEVHSLVYARNSITHLVDVGRTTDIHPPLYFLCLKAWGALFGESREAARLFSTLMSLIGIGLLFFITKRLLGTQTALITTGVIATFPISVHYAREIRMYPFLTTLFLLSFSFFLRFYDDRRDSDARKLTLDRCLSLTGFSIFLALTFYTHYSAAILYMLYTLAALNCLIHGRKAAFFWTFLGLFIATVLILPQLQHLFSNSLGNADKEWMKATTWSRFYSVTLGAFPYHAALKPFVLSIMALGSVLLWLKDKVLAGIVLLFTVGGMVLAAAIGIVEPIYLVRTIQIYTVFTSILVAIALLWVPRVVGVAAGALVLLINVYTVIESEFLPNRVMLLGDEIPGMVALLDEGRDQVFAMEYVQNQMELLHVPLFDYAKTISHDKQEAGIAAINAQAAHCLRQTADPDCRSLIVIIERESRFNTDAIAAWNAMVDELESSNLNHFEQKMAGFRVVIFSNDIEFLARIAASLERPNT